MEDRFGNDGYAFWFKHLELLGDTPGHAYDCNDSINWEFLLTKTRASDVSATEMPDPLVGLDDIDGKLWEHRIILCKNFVDNLSALYDKRTNRPPERPQIPVSLDNRADNDAYIGFPVRCCDATMGGTGAISCKVRYFALLWRGPGPRYLNDEG